MAEKIKWGSLGTKVRMDVAASDFARDAKSWDALSVTVQNQLSKVFGSKKKQNKPIKR